MLDADFNKEFPTRASLRRARQAEQAAQEKARDEAKKDAQAPQGIDEFDAVPEAGTPGAATPSGHGESKSEPGIASAAQAAGANPAPVPGNGKHTPRNTASSTESAVKPPAKPAQATPSASKPAPGKDKSAPAKNASTPGAAATPGPKPAAKVEPKPAARKTPNTKAAASAPATSAPKPAAPAPKPSAAGTPKPSGAKPVPAPKAAAATKPAAKPGAKQTTEPVPTAKNKPSTAAAKPAPGSGSKKPVEPKTVANPIVAAKSAPVADSSKPAEPKTAAKPTVAAKPAPSKETAKPAGTKPVPAPEKSAPAAKTAASAPAPAKAPGNSSAVEDLSTPEGRRQAFREMNPATGTRETFLRPEEETAVRAEHGFRGFLARLGFNMKPSAREIEERTWRRMVGTRLSQPKTISVVNGKGGANKTPTAVLLSAVFGRNTGDPVLVWDNNGTRGTLGWRTVRGPHDAHSMDLLEAAPRLKDVKAGDPVIHDYTHHQPEDRYAVLRTDPTLLASEQFVNAGDFDQLHGIVSRFFALTIVDSGNDESAERWMRMIDHTDQLVIASTTVEEHAEAGALLLEALAKRGGHYADLAKNAVVIVSQHQPHGNSEQLERIAQGFGRLARSVVTVPYDAALVKGQIRFEALRPATRRAWLHATSAVAEALNG